MQVVAVGIEPGLGALDMTADPCDDPPKPRRMIHFDEMGYLMGGKIVQHIGRREDQAPRERQRAGGGARTPAARLIADRQPLHPDAKRQGIGLRHLLQFLAHFPLQVIVDTPVDMLSGAGHAENPLAAFAHFRPYRAAQTGPMHDPMRNAAQRQDGTRMKWRSLWQSTEARGDPAAMTLREVLRVGDRATRRHGQDRFTIAWMNAQGVAARAPVPAQPNRIDLRAVLDQKSRRFVRPPIKEGASGHVCKSGEQEFARILPYLPPVKSLGAKTNHLPNIQGLTGHLPLQNGAGTKNFSRKYPRSAP